ncbi:DUF2924 domain-containing protein [Tabrizicola sp. BL-A-41-H6]|uniref:DUF2924 domain-containing protein n=1 Tax=Tabrizicola sp. BL-A-41-H6 TaxID=3421107 RepID=UPI003D665964
MPSLDTLHGMDRAALLAAWSELFGRPAPKSISQAYLRRFIAFEVQARRAGGLPKGLLRQIKAATLGGGPARRTVEPAPGGRLLREWNGVTHVVEVTAKGYRWNGADHRSLSAIARAITGARWSGPRFFGLREAGR